METHPEACRTFGTRITDTCGCVRGNLVIATVRNNNDNDNKTEKEWWYHWKADELKRANPSALVPTLIPLVPDNNNENNNTPSSFIPLESKAIYESLITIEFIDHISAAPPPDRLIPTTTDPYETARCRVWADRVNRDCCSPYYGVLVRTDPDERARHFQHLLGGLRQFSRQLERTDGPLFLADRQLSSVDLALLPWAYRYYVLEHYRGPEFVIPKDASLDAYHEWFQHCLGLDSVKRTLPDKDQYLEHIEKYADSSARSKVANAVRRGVAAHELDDEKDEYNST
mmetsp:Transcript_39620/g.55843  ORF Transcript_39620/g.55843 Transcript_39620/m.55843 type:complete len:285 (-) Transcript_39620:47-901(-)